MLDEFGYPTDEALDKLENFSDSTLGYVLYVEKLWSPIGSFKMYSAETSLGSVSVVRLVTGGWSGNESVISAMQGSVFWMRCWVSSHRGGLYYFEIRDDDTWEGFLGKFENYVDTRQQNG